MGTETENEKVISQKLEYEEANKKEAKEKTKIKPTPYYRLFRFATTLDKVYLFLGASLSILCGGLQPYMMIIFGDVTGNVVNYVYYVTNTTNKTEEERLKSKLYDDITNFAIQTCSIGVVTIIATYFAGLCFSYSASKQIIFIRKLFFQKILHQDMSWYDVNQTGDFATTITDNLSKIEEGLGDKIGLFFYFESTFVVGILLALINGWELALICLISLPLSTVSMGFVAWLSTKFSQQEMESYGAAGSVAEEVLSSIRTVVAFDGKDKEIDRYQIHLINAKNNNLKRSFFNSLSNAFMWFFVFGCYALSFWYGVGLILKEKDLPEDERTYTAGKMISVFFSTLIGSWNFGMAAPFLEVFGTASGAATKIFDVIDSVPTIHEDKTSETKLPDIKGNISFENVDFNYPSRPTIKILDNFSLTVQPGEIVALVGSSGCGKSTAIHLIQRFYDPNAGKVTIDDTNIKNINIKWLRSKIGVVGQEPALFAASISENIRFGKQTATQQEIENAAKKANAHDFIIKLPNGYQTVIGERGAQLSGGQKQRIAIARALVREPIILLLDEATSALDTNSEAEVQAALDSVAKECTTIIVAHRLSTIRNAHRIIVLNKGNVVEEGTHHQLMERKGDYYQLVLSQGLDDAVEGTQNKTKFEKTLTKIDLRKASFLKEDDEEVSMEEGQEVIKGSILRIIKANSKEWFAISMGCICSIITGASLPIFGVIFGDIVGILANPDEDYVKSQSETFSLYFVIIGILTGVGTFFQIYSFCYAGEQLTLRLRAQAFEAMLIQDMGWYDKKENGVGALCAQLSGDASSVQGAGGMRIGTVINSASTFILSCTLALYFEWKLALVLLSFAPLILLSVYFEQKILQSGEEENQKILERSAKISVEAISNIRTVVSLGCENLFCEMYGTELLPYERMAKKKSHFRSIVLGLARSLMNFAYAVGIFYGAYLIINAKVDYGIVFKVCEIVIAGSWSIGNALSFSPNFQKGLAASGRIFTLLARRPAIRNCLVPTTNILEKIFIKYKETSFSYPTRSNVIVLNKLNLDIPQGKTIALVGSSGCGKSTIVQLLERFYDPTFGAVTLNDDNVKDISLKTLRAQIGIVSQEPNLFDRTIFENIAYGDNTREVDVDDVINAAKAANIHTFITSLPLGYSTRLGSRGTQLSGGQKQRVAIARALVRNPKILLLDEATSALDNESEKVVQEALDNAKQGRTCITIAHRLTTIQDADVICVLQDGSVAEMGTHKELLKLQKLYYKFYNLQLGNHHQ